MRIYDLIHIQIDDRLPWKAEWIESMGDVGFLSGGGVESVAPRSRIIVTYTDNHSASGMRKLDENIFVAPNCLFDKHYRVKLKRTGVDEIQFETKYPCPEWLSWAIQLSLLAAGAFIIHGAGVAKRGKAILFPSWGGVGKTALISKFVKEMGWQLLGDDLVIVEKNGKVRGFPKPMVLYPYHKSVFPEVFQSGRGPKVPTLLTNQLGVLAGRIKPILRRIPRVLDLARKYNPHSARIKPSEVFGYERLCPEAELKSVIWIDRVKGLRDIEFTESDARVPSRIFGSTLNEFDPWCVKLTNIAMGLGIFEVNDFYGAWQRHIESALQDVTQSVLYIPAELPVDKVPNIVRDVLVKNQMWE